MVLLYRSRPAMDIQTLGRGAPGIFGDRLRSAMFLRPLRGAHLHALGQLRRRTHLRTRVARRLATVIARYFRLFFTSPEADGSDTLQQRHAPLLRMLLDKLAALGPDLVLRGQRQLIDAR